MNNKQLGRKFTVENMEAVKGLRQEERNEEILLVEEISHFTMYGVEVKTYEVLSDYAKIVSLAKNGITNEFDFIVDMQDTEGNKIIINENCDDIVLHGMSLSFLNSFSYLSRHKDVNSIKLALKKYWARSCQTLNLILTEEDEKDLTSLLG